MNAIIQGFAKLLLTAIHLVIFAIDKATDAVIGLVGRARRPS